MLRPMAFGKARDHVTKIQRFWQVIGGSSRQCYGAESTVCVIGEVGGGGSGWPDEGEAGRLGLGSDRSGEDRQNDGVQQGQCDGPDQRAEAAATEFEAAYQARGQPEYSGVYEDTEEAEGEDE